MSAPVVGIATRDGRLAVTFTRDGKLEGWAFFDELSYEARDTFLAALEIQKKNNRGKIDLGKIAQQLSENDPFIRTRCRASRALGFFWTPNCDENESEITRRCV